MKDSSNTQEKVRLFVGLKVPESVLEETLRIKGFLQKKRLFVGRWTKPENLHLTLKFLGEVDQNQASLIIESLKSVGLQPFNAVMGELGVFSSKKVIRILWIHIIGEELIGLQRHIDDLLAGHFKPEARFMSHLTIARIKSIAEKEQFLKEIDNFKIKPIKILVDEFSLIKSSLTPNGPVYTLVCNFPLKFIE